MPIYTTKNGISIYYELKNTTHNNQYCLLIGGLTRDHTIWRKVVPLLEQDFQVLTFDNRDAGQSTTSEDDYDIAEMADDIAELIKELNYYPAHIIGHSLGGFMAIHIAAKYPELIKSLVLCSTSEKQEPEGKIYLTNRIKLIDEQFIKNKMASTANKEDIIAVLDKLYTAENLQNAEFVEEIIKHETSSLFPQTAQSFKRQANACIRHDASELINKIICPTLVLTGEKDKYYTPEVAKQLAAKLKNGKLEIITKAAHMVQIEQPIQLVESFKQFIFFNKKAPLNNIL